jgi:hypothetical protein
MIGSPTRFARADRKALSVLKQLRKKDLAEIPVAIFDTYEPVPTDPKNWKRVENGCSLELLALCRGWPKSKASICIRRPYVVRCSEV